jgi:hypothetical protein
MQDTTMDSRKKLNGTKQEGEKVQREIYTKFTRNVLYEKCSKMPLRADSFYGKIIMLPGGGSRGNLVDSGSASSTPGDCDSDSEPLVRACRRTFWA